MDDKNFKILLLKLMILLAENEDKLQKISSSLLQSNAENNQIHHDEMSWEMQDDGC